MNWIPYILLTVAVYFINLTKLKARTEQEKIGSTPVLFNTLIFFAIFEFFFFRIYPYETIISFFWIAYFVCLCFIHLFLFKKPQKRRRIYF